MHARGGFAWSKDPDFIMIPFALQLCLRASLDFSRESWKKYFKKDELVHHDLGEKRGHLILINLSHTNSYLTSLISNIVIKNGESAVSCCCSPTSGPPTLSTHMWTITLLCPIYFSLKS